MKSNRLFALALVASIAGGPLRADDPRREFTPRDGFSGRSEGNGTLRLFLGKPRSFHVESYGYDRRDGKSQLDQTVSLQGRKPQTRHWVMTTVGPHRYTGSLSDAAGTVTGRTDGDRLVLRYRVKGLFVMHQTLRQSSDGRTIDNVGRITLLGVPVGRLQETITRKD